MSLLDDLFAARNAWAVQHGGQFPKAVYLSPLATVRALRATCGVSSVRPELVAHGDDGASFWTVKRFATDVLQMDWFEDTRLTGEAYRFEAGVLQSAHL